MNHLCVGCGICAALCPQGSIQMEFSPVQGFFLPSRSIDSCDTACGLCEHVCPFVPGNSSTTEITREVFATCKQMQFDEVLGYYLGTYVGYSREHRLKSASGGLVTWLLEKMLKRGQISGAICVGPEEKSPTLFDFRICRTADDIRACAGSCYQPVEISRVLNEMLTLEGCFAVVALPCMARGLRLAMRANPKLKSRIRFILGLVCGQMKSRHYIEYIVRKWLRTNRYPCRINFRHKTPGCNPADITFSFSFANSGESEYVRFSDGIGPSFSNGSFNLETCDYCDDVFAECADAVFMDAWLEEYISKPEGHSLALVRNRNILELFDEELTIGSVQISRIAPEMIRYSQTRVKVVPKKRIMNGYNYLADIHRGRKLPVGRWKPGRVEQRLEAFLRRKVRKETHRAWIGCRGDIERFERATLLWRKSLSIFERIQKQLAF